MFDVFLTGPTSEESQAAHQTWDVTGGDCFNQGPESRKEATRVSQLAWHVCLCWGFLVFDFSILAALVLQFLLMPQQPVAHFCLDSFIAYLMPCEVPRAKAAVAPTAKVKATAVPTKKDAPATGSAMHKARWEFAAQHIEGMLFSFTFLQIKMGCSPVFFYNFVS